MGQIFLAEYSNILFIRILCRILFLGANLCSLDFFLFIKNYQYQLPLGIPIHTYLIFVITVHRVFLGIAGTFKLG